MDTSPAPAVCLFSNMSSFQVFFFLSCNPIRLYCRLLL